MIFALFFWRASTPANITAEGTADGIQWGHAPIQERLPVMRVWERLAPGDVRTTEQPVHAYVFEVLPHRGMRGEPIYVEQGLDLARVADVLARRAERVVAGGAS